MKKIITNKYILVLIVLLVVLVGVLFNVDRETPEQKIIREQEESIIENPLELKEYMIETYPNYLEGIIVFSENQAYLNTENTTYKLRPKDPLFYQGRDINNNQKVQVQGKITENEFVVGQIK